MNFDDLSLAKALSSALAPVFLITGISALLGAMNVRYGRVVDRARLVLREVRQHPAAKKPADVDDELRILHRRAKLLRNTVILASAAIFSVVICIFLIFWTTMIGATIPYLIPTIFSIALVFLILSLTLFIEDFAISLGALKREIHLELGRSVIDED